MRRGGMRIAKARWLAAGLTALLAGCAGNDKTADDLNVFPKDYKSEIAQSLSTTLSDPTNLRDTFVSEPARANGGTGPYIVCVRFNPRDDDRKYEGVQDRIAYFYHGTLNQLVPARPEQCGKAAYAPFPELQNLCMAKKCD
jgi:hypothetical protein